MQSPPSCTTITVLDLASLVTTTSTSACPLILMASPTWCLPILWSTRLDHTPWQLVRMCQDSQLFVDLSEMEVSALTTDLQCSCLICGSSWSRKLKTRIGVWDILCIPWLIEDGKKMSWLMLSPMIKLSLEIKHNPCGFLILRFITVWIKEVNHHWEYLEEWLSTKW